MAYLKESSLSVKARLAIRNYCLNTPNDKRSWEDFNKNNPDITKNEFDEGIILFGNASGKTITPKEPTKVVPTTKPASKPTSKPAIPTVKPEIKPQPELNTKPIAKPAVEQPKKETMVVDGIVLSTAKTFPLTVAYVSKRYKEFNEKYFDGKLPTYMPIYLSHQKSCAGCYRYKSRGYNVENVFDEKIAISTFNQWSEFIFLNTLLHEMIHVYQIHVLKCSLLSMRSWGFAHGYTFTSKMNDLNKLGWKIATMVTEEEDQAKVANPEEVRKFKRDGRILMYADDILCVIKRDNMQYYLRNWRRITLKFYDAINPEKFVQYPVCRSAIRGHRMSKKEIDKMVEEGILKPINDTMHESIQNESDNLFDALKCNGAVLVDEDEDGVDTWVIA